VGVGAQEVCESLFADPSAGYMAYVGSLSSSEITRTCNGDMYGGACLTQTAGTQIDDDYKNCEKCAHSPPSKLGVLRAGVRGGGKLSHFVLTRFRRQAAGSPTEVRAHTKQPMLWCAVCTLLNCDWRPCHQVQCEWVCIGVRVGSHMRPDQLLLGHLPATSAFTAASATASVAAAAASVAAAAAAAAAAASALTTSAAAALATATLTTAPTYVPPGSTAVPNADPSSECD
jgi:hypothetical protein